MAKSRKPKPSFDAPASGAPASPAWVYRSDTPDVPGTPAPGRTTAAEAIVARYANYSAAAGLVPMPFIDAAAISSVQVAMLRALATHYDVPFTPMQGKSLVTVLVGGLMPALAGYQMMKLAGPLAGVIGVSGFALASTRAVGHVFLQHFDAGGTLSDLDVEESRRQVADALAQS
jgi:uncharacterized protein (DUF697 family)